VIAEHIYDVLKTTESDTDPNAPYFAALERLTAENWGSRSDGDKCHGGPPSGC